MDDALARLRCFDWEDSFDAAKEVAWHPVCTAREYPWLRAAAILEVEDAAVL